MRPARAGATQEVGALLDALPDPQRAVDAMRRLRAAIEPGHPRTIVLRGVRATWAGSSGATAPSCARKYGGDESFERLVAGIAADFDPATDRA